MTVPKVLAVTTRNDGRLDFTFECSYCKAVNTYKGMNPLRFSEGKIKRLGCRNCNMLGDYVLDTERFYYDEYIVIPWFLDLCTITAPDDYFEIHQWHTIGFCGMNAFAKKMTVS